MLFRDRYFLKQLVSFFFILFISFSVVLLLTQFFWSFADMKRAGGFPWKDYIINFYDNIQLIFPFITLLSAFFVFAEMEKFRQLSVLELKGVSELQIFRTFVIFGFFISIFAFLFGCFPPYPDLSKDAGKRDVSITTPIILLWAEQANKESIFTNVVITFYGKGVKRTIQSRKAEFFNDRIIFYDATVVNGNEDKFNVLTLKTYFDPLILVRYTSINPERQSFFSLRRILKKVAAVGVMDKTDWIVLYSKISYPLLNLMVILLLLPFLYQRVFFSRIKIFVIGIIMMFFTYALYSVGLSLGKIEMIPWQISPWISHIFLLVFCGMFVILKKKIV